MQIFLNCQSRHLVEVEAETSVCELRRIVQEREGVPASSQYLVAGGRCLTEGTLADNGVAALSTVSVGVRVLGGKVHGSLARAGKVKGQTPKVDKEEEVKKKKTGRCKRRLQYNKRFVNVVTGPGKKRGPNSNSE